jgi:hypothetical protein
MEGVKSGPHSTTRDNTGQAYFKVMNTVGFYFYANQRKDVFVSEIK